MATSPTSGPGGGASFNGGVITEALDIEQAGPPANIPAITALGAGDANDGDKLLYLTGSDEAAGLFANTDGSARWVLGFSGTQFQFVGAPGVNPLTIERDAIVGKLGFFNHATAAQPAAIADAAGGAVIDAQARAALNSALAALRALGLIAT